MTYSGAYASAAYQSSDLFASSSNSGAGYYTSPPLTGHHATGYQGAYETKPTVRRTPDTLYSSMDYRNAQPPTLYSSSSYQQTPVIPDTLLENAYNNEQNLNYSPPPSSDILVSEHNYISVMELTHRQIFNLYVRQLPSGNHRSLACKYSRCSYPSAFRTEEEAVQHVTSAHLNQSWEGFVCLTCGVLMARKQDAVRHVKTMNAGKKYECAVCHKSYARKDYRNIHQTRCSSNIKYPADSESFY